MEKGKNIYLIVSNEKDWKWRLTLSISTKQRKWGGRYDFIQKTKFHIQKTIHLLGGSEKGYEWALIINISDVQSKWQGIFSLRDKKRKR